MNMVTFSLLVPILVFLFSMLLINIGRYLGYQKHKWILAGYVFILFASLLALQLLPQERLYDEQGISDQIINQAKEIEHAFYAAVMEGRPDDVEGAYIIEKWSFPLADNTLTIGAQGYYYSEMMVVVEKTEDLSDRIEVTHYATKTIVNRIDVTDKITPASLVFEEGGLFLADRIVEVRLAQFQKEFVVAQLLVEDQEDWFMRPVGAEVMYLRVPEGAEIKEQTDSGIVILGEE